MNYFEEDIKNKIIYCGFLRTKGYYIHVKKGSDYIKGNYNYFHKDFKVRLKTYPYETGYYKTREEAEKYYNKYKRLQKGYSERKTRCIWY